MFLAKTKRKGFPPEHSSHYKSMFEELSTILSFLIKVLSSLVSEGEQTRVRDSQSWLSLPFFCSWYLSISQAESRTSRYPLTWLLPFSELLPLGSLHSPFSSQPLLPPSRRDRHTGRPSPLTVLTSVHWPILQTKFPNVYIPRSFGS